MISYSYEPVEDRLLLTACDGQDVQVWIMTRRMVLDLVETLVRLEQEFAGLRPVTPRVAAARQPEKARIEEDRADADQPAGNNLADASAAADSLLVTVARYRSEPASGRVDLVFSGACNKTLELTLNRNGMKELVSKLFMFSKKHGWLSVPRILTAADQAIPVVSLVTAEKIAENRPTALPDTSP